VPSRKYFYSFLILPGTIIRRHRIPRPPPNDSTFYTVEDLNVGNELLIYARRFKLIDCDEFTRNFLTKLGVQLKPPQPLPEDPYNRHRRVVSVTDTHLLFVL
jgi:DUF1126 PH-like domain